MIDLLCSRGTGNGSHLVNTLLGRLQERSHKSCPILLPAANGICSLLTRG